ncbi:MAG: phosphoribosylanthranilate isomerase [Christensenellaceae bacterium]|jgi:phosphoribosylanthranilate isomerase|nr:phosphoribosylanthranilate isomerase [Christensenellaceae bacterium]
MSNEVKIKICGLTRLEDMECVNEYKPDFIGFVFAKRSKRYCPTLQAKRMRSKLINGIITVGVFDNEPINEIINLYDQDVISIAQLHGGETNEYIEKLKDKRPTLRIVRAIDASKNTDNFDMSLADYLLFDNGNGGSGKMFNWENINIKDIPFFIAGGINNENVTDAIKLKPYAVDVSSGVETDGLKDFKKIRNIIELVRRENIMNSCGGK